MPKKNIDPKLAAKQIIAEHTAAYMSACIYKPDDATELWETMIQECSFILTENFLNGEYTPMQYNAIRNWLADIINGIFKEACDE